MAEGERPQERAQRRRRVSTVEDPPHAAVPQQRHVVDAVCAGHHPRDQRGHLQPRVRTLVTGDRKVFLGERAQARGLGEPDHRDQPCRRHEIRVIKQR